MKILALVISQRQRIVEETDGSASRIDSANGDDANDDSDDEARAKAIQKNEPPKDAIAKFEDYRELRRSKKNTRMWVLTRIILVIPYIDDEHADAATKNPHMKLVFRLVKFQILDESKSIFSMINMLVGLVS
jgi:replication fork protection complex subunit Tof1/Swi1